MLTVITSGLFLGEKSDLKIFNIIIGRLPVIGSYQQPFFNIGVCNSIRIESKTMITWMNRNCWAI